MSSVRHDSLGARIGIDVGGTFTDLVCVDHRGEIRTAKVSSTPEDQARGVFEGIAALSNQYGLQAAQLLQQTQAIVHGTTVAANIMLEFNGARVGLLTTRGFRDIIDLRRNYKEVAFDIRYPAPPPIVRRRHRIGITERVDADGCVVAPLDEAEVVQALDYFRAEGVESVAVCYLFGYLNPTHEIKTLELVERYLPGVPVSLSHQVLPKVREFERLSATLVNAYTRPALTKYLDSLEAQLRAAGYRGDVYVMTNNGGMVRLGNAARRSVDLVLSGPAGGVVAGSELARRSGYDRAITADMGGTSYDICLAEGGRAKLGTDAWINRYRVSVPSLDLHVIGAGGGSIAWVDDGGALRVGPRSAGALPGPACYGRGGGEPTVTDADVLLGYVDAAAFLGGSMRLDVSAAREAILRHVADPLGLDVVTAAAGIFRVVTHNMANGIRHVVAVGGHDPRDFALVAFGGAGAVHATPQARDLGIRTVLVPRSFAPVLCALGDLIADHRVTRTQSFLSRLSTLDLESLNEAFESTAAAALAELGGHLEPAGVTLTCTFDMRYKGQTHEVDVPVSLEKGRIASGSVAGAVARFHDLHERRFSIRKEQEEVEIHAITVDATAPTTKPELPQDQLSSTQPPASSCKGHRPVYFPSEGGFVDTAVYRGSALCPGNCLVGPAIIEEENTSIVVHPGQVAWLNSHQMYVLSEAG